jgi:hypothetical protein
MRNIFLVIFVAVFLQACSFAENMVVPAVDRYCNTASESEREILRARVNGVLAPNSIKVTCAKDEEE